MLNLSIRTINDIVPYKVTLTHTGSLRFSTQYGLIYEVGFVEDYTFMDNGAYQFYILEMTGSRFKEDPLVRQTICTIIEVFFEGNDLVLLYICDMSDGKQSIRNRLFSKWYHEYENRIDFTFLSSQIEIDFTEYYASILIKNTNPQLEEIKETFLHFIEEMKEKLS